MNESSAGGCITKLEGQEQPDCEVLFKAGKREAVESNVTLCGGRIASGKAGIEGRGPRGDCAHVHV